MDVSNDFHPFFERVAQGYHSYAGKDHPGSSWTLKGVPLVRPKGSTGSLLDLEKLGLDTESVIKVSVSRNLSTFPMPGKMTKSDRIELEVTLVKALTVLAGNLSQEIGGSVHSLTSHADWKEVTGESENPNLMPPALHKELLGKKVMFGDMSADPHLKSAGLAQDWPCGRGCYQSNDGGSVGGSG